MSKEQERKEAEESAKAFAQRRLEARACRLVKLIHLQAPEFIIATEITLITSAAMMLFPADFQKAQANDERRNFRRAHGMCEIDGCPYEAGIGVERRFLCTEHAEEEERKTKEEDAEEAKRNAEDWGLPPPK